MRHSLAVFLLLTLAACSTDPTKDENLSADQLYKLAKESIEDHNYETALKRFEALQSRFPYGRYAQQAQIEIAYANYKHDEPAAALFALDQFVKEYPNSAFLDYVYYIKGIINFNENLNSLNGTTFRQDQSERDPAALRESFAAFKELVTRFPDSKYAADARDRMSFLLITLSKHEIHVASYYLRRGAYIAAANRAKGVLIDFPHTPQTRDALQIMVQAYAALGMNDLSRDTQRVLDQNVARDGIKPSRSFFPENQAEWWQVWK